MHVKIEDRYSWKMYAKICIHTDYCDKFRSNKSYKIRVF